jgi:hypothetical protein
MIKKDGKGSCKENGLLNASNLISIKSDNWEFKAIV